MKNVVICGKKSSDDKFECRSSFSINKTDIPIGILHQSMPSFNKNKLKDYVLIRKEAFSCNYRDKAISIVILSNINAQNSETLPSYCSVGSEFVATVLEVGSNVSNFCKGDRVIPIAQYPKALSPKLNPGLPTNFASKRFQILHKTQLQKISKDVPDEAAACLTIAGHTVYSMIEKADLKKGDNILITSLKSNTSLALAIALQGKGYKIWGLTTSGTFKQRFEQLGISKVIVHDNKVHDFIKVDTMRNFVEITGGFNVVFDPFIDLYLGKLTSCLNFNSKYITCGIFAQFKQLGKFETQRKGISQIMAEVIVKNVSIIGNCLGKKRHLEKAIHEYSKGNFNLPLDSIVSGNDIAYFFKRTFNDPERFGKVVYMYDD